MILAEIKKLAQLARIDMTDEEIITIGKDFDSILAYVDLVKEVNNISVEQDENKNGNVLKNVMREDIVTNARGEYRDKIIKEMPETQDGFLRVKKIL
jgi:aspartyl-tRNA(Asn)/glutamyl-tRNA(Gln) amidotransferase subunit C